VSTRNYCRDAWAYIQDVLTGVVPAGKHVRAAVQRQADDLERFKAGKQYIFDVSRANRVCEFIELLPHIKGPLAGQRIRLERWQCFVITTAFGWITPDGHRRFRRVYIEVPRGNGKSAMSSGIGLYMLSADNEGGAEVYSFATTRDQAKIVFGDAQNMARRTPGLRNAFGLEVNSHNINVLQTASKFEALSAEGSTLDGLNTHCAIIDELHAHKTRAVYDVVETSIGKRAQSLLWIITTAGSNRAGICYEVRGFVLKVLQGVVADESQFGIIYGLDDGDDWTTEDSLKKANPNWGVSVMPDVHLALQAKAMTMPSAANNFKTKHLNEWVNADIAWMDMRAWERCHDPNLHIEDFHGQPCYIALDLASKVDLAVKMMLFYKDGMYYAFGEYYLPRDTVERGENSQYSGWEIAGHLHVTEGAIIDFGVIEDRIVQNCKDFEVLEVPYDPFQATQLSMRLLEQGVNMVEVRPTVLNFSEPMKELEAIVLAGKFRHNGDPVLAWNVSNTVCHVDAKDNIYPRKERNENKIDGVVALIMALNRSLAARKNEQDISGFLNAPISGKYR
jgi:phage terminase large subunit-like protein